MTLLNFSAHFIEKAAINPNGPEEKELETSASQAYNGAYDDVNTRAVVKALWFAFCARERFVPENTDESN